jgi:hypothetical protein
MKRIGRAVVKYSVYPNGTIMVYVACSNNPFKLEDEITLYSFLGQVRDRHVMDPDHKLHLRQVVTDNNYHNFLSIERCEGRINLEIANGCKHPDPTNPNIQIPYATDHLHVNFKH